MVTSSQYEINDSPWTEKNTAGVSFEDFRSRIMASHELQKAIEDKEKLKMGDINLQALSTIEAVSEEEQDRKLFNEMLKKGIVNIKNLVLKDVQKRTAQENEFLMLYLKYQFSSVFSDIEKSAVEMFV